LAFIASEHPRAADHPLPIAGEGGEPFLSFYKKSSYSAALSAFKSGENL
jgi:hypothetical protein